MPRQARIDTPGALHHIIVRGIERQAIFRDNDDRYDYLSRIGKIFLETSTACYAWSLMTNHTHFLISTGSIPVATVMRRLLTGYAVSFNHRHHRHGQLFQNRYKSILCEEDSYLLELTRYIHLNPLRAGVVSDLKFLDVYPFSGHAVLMGNRSFEWQTTEPILQMFHSRKQAARSEYRNFVMEGIAAGKRPELVGGGLIRSAGGWKTSRENLKGDIRVKGDERILGSGEFVEAILKENGEQLEHRYKLQSQGIGIQQLAHQVAKRYDIELFQLMSAAKYPQIVQARSLLCYLAVRELGMTATALAKSLGMTQPAVSISVKRGEAIVKEQEIETDDFIKL